MARGLGKQADLTKIPDYGLGQKSNAAVYRLFGDKLQPGQRPTPQMIAVAEYAQNQEDVQQDVAKSVATFNATFEGKLKLAERQGAIAGERS